MKELAKLIDLLGFFNLLKISSEDKPSCPIIKYKILNRCLLSHSFFHHCSSEVFLLWWISMSWICILSPPEFDYFWVHSLISSIKFIHIKILHAQITENLQVPVNLKDEDETKWSFLMRSDFSWYGSIPLTLKNKLVQPNCLYGLSTCFTSNWEVLAIWELNFCPDHSLEVTLQMTSHIQLSKAFQLILIIH